MKIKVTRSDVNDAGGARVTVFGLFDSGWQAAVMRESEVGNPASFAHSSEEFVCRFTASKNVLARLCAALDSRGIHRQKIIDVGGNYGGNASIEI